METGNRWADERRETIGFGVQVAGRRVAEAGDGKGEAP
jgi:hypothetical protein